MCDSVPNFLLLIAQADAAKLEVELTTGESLATALAIVVLVASCVTVFRCFLRWAEGGVVMPAARRRPLHVSTPVAVVGVFIAAMLAALATVASLGLVPRDEADNQKAAVEVEPVDEKTKQPAVQSVAEPTDTSPTDTEPTVAEPADEKQNPNGSGDRQAWEIITGILWMNGTLLLLFGAMVWLIQADGPGRSVSVDDVDSTELFLASAQPVQGDREFVSSLGSAAADHSEADLQNLQAGDEEAGANSNLNQAATVVHERWDMWVELKFAGLAFLMALGPTLLTRLIVVSFMAKPKSHAFIEMIEDGGLSVQLLVLLMLVATIAAPLVEELLYRVVVLGGLLNRRPPWVAMMASSVLFCFAHGFPDCISLLPLSVILGYTYVQRRSYRTVMLVHLIFNAFNMSLVMLQMA